MSTRPFTTVAIAALAVIAMACADEAPVADVAVAESPLGDHLVADDGMTIYLFTEDPEGESVCTADCLANWPAVTVDGDPQVGDGVDGDLVGTIEREDTGETQLTYAGMPMYRFAADAAPGDVEGQGVNDVWFVVAPDGSAIEGGLDGAGDDDDDDRGGY